MKEALILQVMKNGKYCLHIRFVFWSIGSIGFGRWHFKYICNCLSTVSHSTHLCGRL